MTDPILRAAAELNQPTGELPMKEIFKALANAQKNFEAAKKDAKNPHFSSKYASLDSCMDAVRGPLNDQGIFVTQTIESVENGVLIETMFAHESGQVYLGGKLFMPVTKHDAQGYGSAITYGRRYSLLAACGVAPEDDDGNSAASAKPAKMVHKPTGDAVAEIPPGEIEHLRDLTIELIATVKSGNPNSAFDQIEKENLDGEQKTALWTMLDSATRSAIKRAKVEA